LDEEIGFWGTQAKDFRASLDAIEGDLDVEINSPGGEVMAGLGMYNMLRARAAAGTKITTRVTGVAASIASVIALAGDKREMPKNAFAMTHGVSGMAWGTEDVLRDQADAVGKMNASIRSIYMDRMGVDEAKATELMSKDTWLTGEECLDLGFATALTDAVEATARFDMDRAELPENVRAVFTAKAEPVAPPDDADDSSVEAARLAAEAEAARVAAENAAVPETPVAEQIVAEAKKVGFEAHAAFFAVNFASFDEAKARMGVAREINALCNVVGKPELAAKAIRGGKSTAEVRAELVDAMASEDLAVDNKQPKPNGQTARDNAKPADVNPTALWASHNAQLQLKGS
jgi:ATP-dependent protease ClpP protease subunit